VCCHLDDLVVDRSRPVRKVDGSIPDRRVKSKTGKLRVVASMEKLYYASPSLFLFQKKKNILSPQNFFLSWFCFYLKQFIIV